MHLRPRRSSISRAAEGLDVAARWVGKLFARAQPELPLSELPVFKALVRGVPPSLLADPAVRRCACRTCSRSPTSLRTRTCRRP